MVNIKNFILYTTAVSVSLITGVIYITQKWFAEKWSLLQLISALLVTVCLLILYLSFNSWLNNLIFYLFFKVKNYQFLSVNIFPFVLIYNNRRKIKISFSPVGLMQVHTKISLRGIKSEEDCRTYVGLYKFYIRILFVFSWLLNLAYFFSCFRSLWLGLFLAASNITAGCLYMTKASEMQMGGLWEYGMGQGQEIHLFGSVCLEQGDKSGIYASIQKIYPLEIKSANGKEFVIHLLMDCICEKKNYLTEETEQMLEKLYLPGENCKFRELPVEYLRMAGVYYIYCLEKSNYDVRVKNLVRNSWQIIKDEYESYEWGKKVLTAISQPEKFDLNDIFEVYSEKSRFVYSLFSNMDKLLTNADSH